MLVRTPEAALDGRLAYRLEFRTHKVFDAHTYDVSLPGQSGTAFYRLLRRTRLSRLPRLLDGIA
jgi:hypothetical protein